MTRYFSIVLLAASAATATAGIAQHATPKIKIVSIKPTSSTSGQQMYTAYCAVCHGTDGRGGGPAASALKAHPVDLSQLSQTNGGVYPGNRVSDILKSGVPLSAHGSAEMPIWGELFFSLNSTSQADSMIVQQRIHNINDYLKTLQR
jgi:mono/diheme cytochrome c family protein